jgi:hypothetical protein
MGMQRSIGRLVFGLLAVVALSGCGLADHPTPTHVLSQVQAQSLVYYVAQARANWEAHQIQDYRLTLQYRDGIVLDHIMEFDILVRSGVLVSSACMPTSCPISTAAKIRSVDDIFALAQGREIPSNTATLSDCLHDLQVDPTYAFPTRFTIDCPQWLGEEHNLQVVDFEVLPAKQP